MLEKTELNGGVLVSTVIPKEEGPGFAHWANKGCHLV